MEVRYKNEAEIMKVLDIDTWRNLSKDKILQFAALMPEMDGEVAIRVVEQFPEFRMFATEALNVIEKDHTSTLTFNKDSQERVHHAFQHARTILERELGRDDLTAEDRRIVIEALLETANREFAKDSENKEFLNAQLNKVTTASLAAIALGIVFVGGKLIREIKG